MTICDAKLGLSVVAYIFPVNIKLKSVDFRLKIGFTRREEHSKNKQPVFSVNQSHLFNLITYLLLHQQPQCQQQVVFALFSED